MVGKLSADTQWQDDGKLLYPCYTVKRSADSDVAPAAGTKAVGTPNITQPTIDEGPGDPNLTQPISTPVDPETPMDPTDIIALVDTAPDEKPLRDASLYLREIHRTVDFRPKESSICILRTLIFNRLGKGCLVQPRCS